ncbi:MAG: hypothetical protein ACF8NJ_10005 [Phycisphaerales bacterium JB038]
MAKLNLSVKRELLRQVLRGEHDLEELCDGQGLTLEQLAGWAEQARTRGTLAALRRLADLRTQLMISRYRAHAAARLIELTGGEESLETARKACVDLLRVNVADREDSDFSLAAEDAAQVCLDTKSVRSFLAELGRASTEEPA